MRSDKYNRAQGQPAGTASARKQKFLFPWQRKHKIIDTVLSVILLLIIAVMLYAAERHSASGYNERVFMIRRRRQRRIRI